MSLYIPFQQANRGTQVNLTGGIQANSACSGIIPAIPRLGFPGLCLSDAGNGVRSTDFVSSWPSGLSVGASWNRDLARKRAVAMAGEFRTKGVNVALGPVVGPLGRIATGGRNWEGGFLPYLSITPGGAYPLNNTSNHRIFKRSLPLRRIGT